MKITDIRIRLTTNEDSKRKAVASITIDDCFVVHDIKIFEGNQGFLETLLQYRNTRFGSDAHIPS